MMRDSYMMDVDRERNCYSCRRFGNLVKNYRNQEIIGQGKRIEYGNNVNTLNNLKEKESLIVLD